MKNLILIVTLWITILCSCQSTPVSEQDQLLQFMTTFEKTVMKDNPEGIYSANPEDLDSLERMYQNYIDRYSGDSICADLLFRSAGILTVRKKIDQAIICYQKIEVDYPGYSFHPYALFNQAVLLETELGKMDLARKKYEKYLSLYPDHEYAEAVRQNLSILDIPAEELLKELQGRKDSLAIP